MMKKYLFFTIIICLLYSCDILVPTDNYYISDTITNNATDTNTVFKKVLLIEVTGIRCPNCPEAHEKIHQLQNVNPGKIIAVAIHGTGLAYPVGDYVTDLRTEDGNEFVTTFGINSIPIGLVDNYNKTSLLSLTAWDDAVSNALIETPQIDIRIENFYNSSDNNIDISVEILSLSSVKSELKLCVYILEDSIITRQATVVAPGYIENYVQLNVFRDAISNMWGDDILTGGESSETKTYSYIVNNQWNADNCRIVAFVFDSNSKVLNVEEKSVK